MSEVWESRQALDRSFQTRLGQAQQRAGIGIQPQFYDVVNAIHP